MFMIVTRETDFPVYEIDLQSLVLRTKKAQEPQQMYQFILNAALDPIEQMQFTTPSAYLKTVDKYNEMPGTTGQLLVNCFLTPSNAKFLLLHEGKSEDQIRQFFSDVYEVWVRLTLNPFFDPNEKVQISQFDQRIQMLAKKAFPN